LPPLPHADAHPNPDQDLDPEADADLLEDAEADSDSAHHPTFDSADHHPAGAGADHDIRVGFWDRHAYCSGARGVVERTRSGPDRWRQHRWRRQHRRWRS
jgi:hypothetical protein